MYDALQVPKQSREQFTFHLVQDRSAWFLEVGNVGLVYFTELAPGAWATLNLIFWDGKLGKERIDAVRSACQMAASRFELQRISARIKWSNRVMRDVLKRAGLIWEGTIRKGWFDEKGYEDMLLFGVTSEEL